MTTPNRESRRRQAGGDSATFDRGDVIGHYRIVRLIASGGFGCVYEADDSGTGRRVALKVLHAELRTASDPFLRFLREARVYERVRHPNIARVFDSGVLPDGRAYLAMELLSGCDLAQHVAQTGALSLDAALDVLAPVCDALAHAHAAGVIHRDVKPSNVFLDQYQPDARKVFGRVVLLDFGLAKLLEGVSVDLTSSRMGLGTPATMAPEQICGEPVTLRTDVYGLGALTYFMLTGRLPFEGNSRTVVQYMHLHGERPRPSGIVDVSPALDRVVARAMAPQPEDRHSSVDAFLSALRDAGTAATPLAAGPAKAQALAVMVHVDVRDSDALDGASLDAIAAVLDEADRALADHYTPCVEASDFAVYARPLSSDPAAHRAQRADAVTALVALHAALVARLGGRDGVHVNLSAHCGDAVIEGDRVRDGEVLRTEAWAPQGAVGGLAGTLAVFDGVDVSVEPIPNTALLRVVPLAQRAEPPAAGAAIPAVPASDKQPAEITRERLMHSEMMAQIGRQTAGIVHDLRSLLSGVIGNLDLLLEVAEGKRPFDEDDREGLVQAIQSTERSIELATSILSASALKSYARQQHTVAIRDIIDTAVNLSASELRRKARVEVACGCGSRVTGARGRLTQVFVNLLVNAAHAVSSRDGRIAISSSADADGMVTIDVRDNGRGMSPEVMARIFEPFYTTKEVGEGTGLGLSLVREIIEEHSGTISVASDPGAGTCFTIRLPRV